MVTRLDHDGNPWCRSWSVRGRLTLLPWRAASRDNVLPLSTCCIRQPFLKATPDRRSTMFDLFASNRLAKRIFLGLTLGGVLTACGTAALQHEEERLTFRVVRETPGWYSGLPDGVQEFDLPVSSAADAPHFHAWWWPAADPAAPAILYLHGTRWSLTGQVFRIEQLRDFGFSVLAIDYRGFGKSDGETPSEKTVYEDARVAWDWLAKEQPDVDKRFIYGHSLGGAIAVELAAAISSGKPNAPAPAHGLIIESTFTT